MNVCPLCNKDNPVTEWVCEDCGAKLPLHGQKQAPASRQAPGTRQSSPQPPTVPGPASVPGSTPVSPGLARSSSAPLTAAETAASNRTAAIVIGIAVSLFVLGAVYMFTGNTRLTPIPTETAATAPVSGSAGSSGAKVSVSNITFAIEGFGTQPLSAELRHKGVPVVIGDDMKSDIAVVKLSCTVRNNSSDVIATISYDRFYRDAGGKTVDSSAGFGDKMLNDERYASAFATKDSLPFSLRPGEERPLVLYDLVSSAAAPQIKQVGQLRVFPAN